MGRKINRRTVLGLAGLTAVGATSCLISSPSPVVLPPKIAIDTAVPIPDNYQLIKTHEKRLTKFYLGELRKIQFSGLDEAMNAHGDEKMHGVYFKLYLDALNHARDNTDKKIVDDKRVFRGIAEEFTTALKKNDIQGTINFTNGPVVDAYVNWARLNSEFYGKLLVQKKSGDFGGLLRSAYPEKEGFEELLKGQDDGIDLIYDAFSKSVIGGIPMKIASFVPLKNIRGQAKEFYRGARTRDYVE